MQKKEINCLSDEKKKLLKENVAVGLAMKENNINGFEFMIINGFMPALTFLLGILFSSGIHVLTKEPNWIKITLLLLLIDGVIFIIGSAFKIKKAREKNNIYFLKLAEFIQMLQVN